MNNIKIGIQQSLQSTNFRIQKKKHLFIFSQESRAAKYGVGTYIQQLVECFDSSDWYIHVIELNSLVEHYEGKKVKDIYYYQIPMPRNLRTPWDEDKNNRYNMSVFYLLATRVAEGEEVYCHFNFAHEQELALLLKNRLNAKIILTLHYTDWSFELLGDREQLKQILHRPLNAKDNNIAWHFERERKFMTKCCDKIIVIAHHSYDTLRSLYGIPKDKLIYIANALKDEYIERSEIEIDKLRKKYRIGSNEKLIIFAGRLDVVKGLTTLLEAFKLLQIKTPDVRLIIAGDGDYKSSFHAANPCWTKVTFTGFISKEQLYELYAIADIGIVPSLYEEFGYVAVEMMMNKLAVIVNDTTGLKEITDNGKYGQLIDIESIKNPMQYMEYLHKSLQNTGNKHMGESGRLRFKEKYCLEIFKKEIKLLYHDIIKKTLKTDIV